MLLTFSFNRYGNLSLHSGAHERQSTIVNRQSKYIVSRSFTALWAILKSRALKSLNTHLKKLTRWIKTDLQKHLEKKIKTQNQSAQLKMPPKTCG